MTADSKYSHHITGNLLQPVQMDLLQEYFILFLESTHDLECFEKKLEPHTLSISEIIHSEKGVYLNA